MRIYEEDYIFDAYKDETTVQGRYLAVGDKYITLFLYSDKLEKGNKPTTRERSEIETLINWLNKRDVLEWIDSDRFNITDIYICSYGQKNKEELSQCARSFLSFLSNFATFATFSNVSPSLCLFLCLFLSLSSLFLYFYLKK